MHVAFVNKFHILQLSALHINLLQVIVSYVGHVQSLLVFLKFPHYKLCTLLKKFSKCINLFLWASVEMEMASTAFWRALCLL